MYALILILYIQFITITYTICVMSLKLKSLIQNYILGVAP